MRLSRQLFHAPPPKHAQKVIAFTKKAKVQAGGLWQSGDGAKTWTDKTSMLQSTHKSLSREKICPIVPRDQWASLARSCLHTPLSRTATSSPYLTFHFLAVYRLDNAFQ
jgi:hypothetical protein